MHFYFSSQTEEREVMQLVGADRTLPATKTIWLEGKQCGSEMDTLHLSPPSFLLCTGSFTFTRTSWLSYTSWLLISLPRSLHLSAIVAFSPSPTPSIHDSLLFLSDAPLMANAERWQMDMTSRWFCLSSLITQIQSAVTRGLRLVKQHRVETNLSSAP